MSLGLALLAGCGGPPPPTTVLLGAMPEEIALFEEAVTEVRPVRIGGRDWLEGRAGERRVVLGRTGIGKTNAAAAAALLIDHYAPERILFSGIAGGVSEAIDVGDVVIASRLAHHDAGHLTADGLEPRPAQDPRTGESLPLFLPGDPALVALAERVGAAVDWEPIPLQEGVRTPRVLTGTVVTGDVFVANSERVAWLVETFDADAVEMEGAAVAQVALQAGVPCLVVRSVSDGADEAAKADEERFWPVAARNAAHLTLAVLDAL